MKTIQKTLAIVLAVVMVLALGVSAFAAEITKVDGVTGDASIKVTLPTIPAGATADNTYKIYKVFDATSNGESESISYKLVSGKTEAPVGFNVDTAGNVTHEGDATELTADEIAAIAAYVKDADLVATVRTTASDKDFTVTGLPYGYYYITTTTGSVVVVDSTNPNAEVADKNTVPEVDKKITGASDINDAGKKAIQEVGKDVEYTVTITVGKGAENYVFHDKMDSSLSYNNDVKVTVNGAEVESTNYNATTATGETITIAFNNDYIDTLAKDTKIVITYSAKVTSDALTVDPAKNTAWLDYGDENSSNSTPKSETKTYNAKFTVTKQDGDKKPLAGAGFVIAKTVTEGEGTDATPKTVYYKLENGVVSWVDSIDDATEYTSDKDGAVTAFTGLADGTYTLIEKTVPAGYNKAADSTFTVDKGDYTATNLEKTSTVVNNAGSELPSTGGIGTTIFYIVGAILVVGAAVVLVSKKRMSAEQ